MASGESILLGRIALDLGFIGARQLAELLAEQAGTPGRLLGEIMVSEGYLDAAELKRCLDEQQRRLATHSHYASKPRRDVLFGKVLAKLSLVEEAEVNRYLALQGRLEEQDHRYVPLGVLLAEAGKLTYQQVEQVLSYQDKRILVCPGCSRRYNAALYEAGMRFRCRECDSVLEVPAADIRAGLVVHAEVFPEVPGQAAPSAAPAAARAAPPAAPEGRPSEYDPSGSARIPAPERRVGMNRRDADRRNEERRRTERRQGERRKGERRGLDAEADKAALAGEPDRRVTERRQSERRTDERRAEERRGGPDCRRADRRRIPPDGRPAGKPGAPVALLAGIAAGGLVLGLVLAFILIKGEPPGPSPARLAESRARSLLDAGEAGAALKIIEGRQDLEPGGQALLARARDEAGRIAEAGRAKAKEDESAREGLAALFALAPARRASALAELKASHPDQDLLDWAERTLALIAETVGQTGSVEEGRQEFIDALFAEATRLQVTGSHSSAWRLLSWAAAAFPGDAGVREAQHRCERSALAAYEASRETRSGDPGAELGLARHFGAFPFYKPEPPARPRASDWTSAREGDLARMRALLEEGKLDEAGGLLDGLARGLDDPAQRLDAGLRALDLERAAGVRDVLLRRLRRRAAGAVSLELEPGVSYLAVYADSREVYFQSVRGGATQKRAWSELKPPELLALLEQTPPQGVEGLGVAALALELGLPDHAHRLVWKLHEESEDWRPACVEFASRRLGVEAGEGGLDFKGGRLVPR